MPAPLWTFAVAPPPLRSPRVVLVAFSEHPLQPAEAVPFSLSRYGAPRAEALDDVSATTVERAQDPAWFDAWRAGSLRAIAQQDLSREALRTLDAARYAHLLQSAPSRPRDLAYLQTAWALARHLAARGASVVLDAFAMGWRDGDALGSPDAPLDVSREVRVVFETDETAMDGQRAHALHTRGLRKFGAPELIALCGQPDAAAVGSVVSRLADAVARGTELQHPRHEVVLGPAGSWFVVDDVRGLSGLLELDHEARVLVDHQGHHLVGAGARLAASHN